MKRQIKVLILILAVIAIVAGCKSVVDKKTDETDSIRITGRIVEIEDNTSILIRNEEDTSIYYRIGTNEGLVFSDGVNQTLNPDNVIAADVEILNSESIPKETKLIVITENKSPDYQVIDAARAKAIIDKGNALVVDVRTRAEYESGYIPDAYNVPLDQIKNGIKNVTDDKNATILVYCRSGNRSKVAARILTEMGYTNIYDFGGIIDWPYDITEQ